MTKAVELKKKLIENLRIGLFTKFHKFLLYSLGLSVISYGIYYSYYNFFLYRGSPKKRMVSLGKSKEREYWECREYREDWFWKSVFEQEIGYFFKKISKASFELHELKNKIQKVHQKALGKSIVTLNIKRHVQAKEENMVFDYLVLENLGKKNSSSSKKTTNPFLPPFEEGLYICDIGEDHRLLFNKFAVVKMHMLVVTKNFENQSELLTKKDFQAACRVSKSVGGFCFYNSGPESGHSQSHKHIQVIPGSYSNESNVMKTYSKLVRKNKTQATIRLPEFVFDHSFKNLEEVKDEDNLEKCADIFLKNYNQALKDLGNTDGSLSYNLIWTEEWLLIVLRSKEKALEKFSLNSMAFTGSFLVKDEEELKEIQSVGPLKILREIGSNNIQKK